MSTLGMRIRVAREKLNLQQNELASIIGAKSDVISNWERDINKPNLDKLVLLCDALNVTLSYLLDYYGSDDVEFSVNDRRMIAAYNRAPETTKRVVDVALEPYMIEVSAPIYIAKAKNNIIELPLPLQSLGAGLGEPYNDSERPELITVKIDGSTRKADYVMRVDGDSMEPDFPSGCLVAVQKSGQIEYGEIGVFELNSEYFIKILGRKGLQSINPNYKVIAISEYDNLCCYGKVLGIVEQ